VWPVSGEQGTFTMSTTIKLEEFRRNAKVCLLLARDAKDTDREVYLEIAQHWTSMAQELEATLKPQALPDNVVIFPGERHADGSGRAHAAMN
jgi:hypothetical protein